MPPGIKPLPKPILTQIFVWWIGEFHGPDSYRNTNKFAIHFWSSGWNVIYRMMSIADLYISFLVFVQNITCQISIWCGWYTLQWTVPQLSGKECTGLKCNMMTSSNGNIFRVTGPLCGEFTGPGEFPTQSQWRGALMFTLICVWINGWVNNHEAGDLRRHRGHYDFNVMRLLWLLGVDFRNLYWLVYVLSWTVRVTTFPCQFERMEHSFNFIQVITGQFCPWHHSHAVVACAKLYR